MKEACVRAYADRDGMRMRGDMRLKKALRAAVGGRITQEPKV